MTGIIAFLADVTFPLITGCLLVATLRSWRKRKSLIDTAFVILGGFLFVLLTVIFLGVVLIKAHDYYRLQSLRAEQVAYIEVSGANISDTDTISRIIGSLNDVEWYTTAHGRGAKPMPFVIKMKSGKQYRLVARYHLSLGGAVIRCSFRDEDDSSVFSKGLPQALDSIGIQLPKN